MVSPFSNNFKSESDNKEGSVKTGAEWTKQAQASSHDITDNDEDMRQDDDDSEDELVIEEPDDSSKDHKENVSPGPSEEGITSGRDTSASGELKLDFNNFPNHFIWKKDC